uniref:Uncharacterized protein n=1 Tax=Solanum tuberosum TaxID=4113 RepID=M1DLK2_SOLTU
MGELSQARSILLASCRSVSDLSFTLTRFLDGYYNFWWSWGPLRDAPNALHARRMSSLVLCFLRPLGNLVVIAQAIGRCTKWTCSPEVTVLATVFPPCSKLSSTQGAAQLGAPPKRISQAHEPPSSRTIHQYVEVREWIIGRQSILYHWKLYFR